MSGRRPRLPGPDAGRFPRGTRPRRRRALATALRSVTASARVLGVRRAGRDIWLLLALTCLVAVSTLLSVAGPRVVLQTVDGGARDAVVAAGAAADVRIETPVGSGTGERPTSPADGFEALAEALPARLPDALRQVVSEAVTTLVGPPTPLLAKDGVPDRADDADGEVHVQLAALPRSTEVVVVDGALPAPRAGAPDAPIEVLVSAAAADVGGLEVGSTLTVGAVLGPELVAERPGHLLVVVGVVEPAEPDAVAWSAMPEVWAPVRQEARSDRSAYTRFTVLTGQDGAVALSGSVPEPFTGSVRLVVDPDTVGTDLAARVGAEIRALRVDTSGLADAATPFSVRTGLDAALESYPAQARAALAQMSVMIAGVIGVAGVVIILLSRLLVIRRSAVLALERARGASVPAVLLRLGVEALVVAALGGALGVGAAWLLVPGPVRDVGPPALVLVVALLAGPLQAAWLTRRAWTGRREPANRQDRAQLHKRRRLRRLVVEAAVVLLAVGAVVSLRGRGLLQRSTEGIDTFLAAAPILVALAVTLLLLRVHPYPVRAVGALGRRTRGVLGLLGAVRAQQAVAPLPLLALTLGVALAVAGGMLVGTVRDGQVDASWERVGADLRVEAPVDADQVDLLREQPQVLVASGEVSGQVVLDLGTENATVTVMALDPGYRALVAAIPGAEPGDGLGLEPLGVRGGAGDALPVVVDAALADRVVGDELAMYLGASYVRVRVVGTTGHTPEGYLEGPFVYADLDALSLRTGTPPDADTVWLVGPGAGAAVARLGLPDDVVVSRAEWLDARRGLALMDGVEQMMVLAVLAVCVLGLVALVATVLAGARERGRALSMLRTLGMSPRLGWWLALAELAPVVLAALTGGILAGLVIVLVLAPALGLDVLAGGLGVPDPSISPAVIGGLAAGAAGLLLLAVLAEVLAHRRDRLSDVLRVGETV